MAKYIIIFLLSVLLVLSSLIIPSMAHNPNELQGLEFGYPIHFVHPLSFSFINYVLSVLVVWCVILGTSYVIKKLNHIL